MQALNSDNTAPDVVAYRHTMAEAESWKNNLANRGGYRGFLIHNDREEWAVYDGDGRFVVVTPDPVGTQIQEVLTHVDVDRALMQAEARRVLLTDGITMIACAESHAGAAAVDHSNFVVMCRRLILEGTSSDIKHVYLTDSRLFGCRAIGMLSDVSELSSKMQDLYLDRVKHLKNSWPLNVKHHRDMLADRLAKTRSDYMLSLLSDCARAARMNDEMILSLKSAWLLASPGAKYRFAQHVTSVLREGIKLAPRQPETFDPEVVKALGSAVVRNFHKILS